MTPAFISSKVPCTRFFLPAIATLLVAPALHVQIVEIYGIYSYSSQFIGYGFLGGVDYPLVHFFNVRLLEVGGHTTFGSTNNHAHPTFLTINSGLVFHF